MIATFNAFDSDSIEIIQSRMLAESKPEEKEVMVKLVMNLLKL